MPAPTPVTANKQVGHRGIVVWQATWADTTDLSDAVVVDLSGLTAYTTRIVVTRVYIVASTGLGVTLEFDADSADQLIAHLPVGANAPLDLCFLGAPDGGLAGPDADGTDVGDIVVTTTSAAAADSAYIYIEYWVA